MKQETPKGNQGNLKEVNIGMGRLTPEEKKATNDREEYVGKLKEAAAESGIDDATLREMADTLKYRGSEGSDSHFNYQIIIRGKKVRFEYSIPRSSMNDSPPTMGSGWINIDSVNGKDVSEDANRKLKEKYSAVLKILVFIRDEQIGDTEAIREERLGYKIDVRQKAEEDRFRAAKEGKNDHLAEDLLK